mmetsp:Transcript_109212/g.308002  ORF Transcript_109212/g.308002 Transcript_109212/m.308002 type:complete len:137 (+) Transcript_109212:107-517(+)
MWRDHDAWKERVRKECLMASTVRDKVPREFSPAGERTTSGALKSYMFMGPPDLSFPSSRVSSPATPASAALKEKLATMPAFGQAGFGAASLGPVGLPSCATPRCDSGREFRGRASPTVRAYQDHAGRRLWGTTVRR